MASTDVNAPAVALSPAARDKYISDLAKGQPSPGFSKFAWFVAFVSIQVCVYVWSKAYAGKDPSTTPDDHQADHISLITLGLAIGSFALGNWLRDRKQREAADGFARRDDQMLQVLHAELIGNQKTTAIVIAVLLAAAIIGAVIYFTQR